MQLWNITGSSHVEYIINIRIGTEYFISVKKKLTSFQSIDQYTMYHILKMAF